MTTTAVWNLDTRRLGQRVLVFDEIDSTNNYAATLATDPANDGVAVLASRQTAGRGQYGRAWNSPPNSSVLLSVLIFPPVELRRAAVLTSWAAVSVCETVRTAIHAECQVRWPNDVLLNGRKLCGILTEQGRGTVVGIGLNVNQTAEDFSAAGLPSATSLATEAGRPFDCLEIARQLIRQLDNEYDQLLTGNLEPLETRWKRRIGLVGEIVVVECADRKITGRLLEMGFDGLVLDLGNGETHLLAPELVKHVSAV